MHRDSLKIGMIGLDTSHVTAFAQILHDPASPHNARITTAYAGGSMDIDLSIGRVAQFTEDLQVRFGTFIVESPEEVAHACDAIMIETIDGRKHLELFQQIAPFGKPVFIDKPLTVTSKDAKTILSLSKTHNVPWFSSSALRFNDAFVNALKNSSDQGEIIGVDVFGPMELIDVIPGYFWYGIHSVEMVFAALGSGCEAVQVTGNSNHDILVGSWSDGRCASVRGNRKGNESFGGTIHREKGSFSFDCSQMTIPHYAHLLDHIISFFRGSTPPVNPEETLQVIRFLEAANKSRTTGMKVNL